MRNRTNRSRRGTRLGALSLAAALLAAVPVPASAKSDVGHAASDAGLGLAAGVLTALYVPLKAAIASTGFVVGGAAWLVTGFDPEPAHSILRTTAGGDWLITQQHLQGRDDFAILGRQRPHVAHR
jgi:hypothetical protein